jgi:hypothetical protein
MFSLWCLRSVITVVQLASTPYANGEDPKRNLLWRDEDFSTSFIICVALLLGAAVIGFLATVGWGICELLLWLYPEHSVRRWLPPSLGLLGFGVGVLLTVHYPALEFTIIPFPAVVGLYLAGIILGFQYGKTKNPPAAS